MDKINELIKQYQQVQSNEDMAKDISGALIVELFNYYEMELIPENIMKN